MKTEYTIIQDSNEHKPLIFPKTLVTLNDTVLPTSNSPSRVVRLHLEIERLGKAHKEVQRGDYYLKGYQDRCIVEKKGNLDEIANNLLKPRARRNFINELDYLADKCLWPVILLEGTPAKYMTPTGRNNVPEVALASLMRLCLERKIWLHFVPKGDARSRALAGEWAAQILIAGAVTSNVRQRR